MPAWPLFNNRWSFSQVPRIRQEEVHLIPWTSLLSMRSARVRNGCCQSHLASQPSKSSQTPTFIWLSHYNIPSYYSLNHRHESIFPYREKLEHKLWVPNQSDKLPSENLRPIEEALPWLEILDSATTQKILSARPSIRSARLYNSARWQIERTCFLRRYTTRPASSILSSVLSHGKLRMLDKAI